MARPTDNSLKYYNQDTKDDDNLQYIEALHSLQGYAIVHKLWKHIYGGPGGYYCEWSNINKMLFCKNNSIDIKLLEDVLKTCFSGDIKIFDRRLSNDLQILTSKGIQKRWSKIVKEAGRKIYLVKEEHRLICLDGDTLPINHQQTTPPLSLIGEETPQSKVKQSIENETKIKESGANKLPPPPIIYNTETLKTESERKRNTRPEKFIPPSLQEAITFFIKIIGNVKKPGHWAVNKCESEADKFINHYQANGWKQGKGKPIVDWQASCRNWITNEREGAFAPQSKINTTEPIAAVSLPVQNKAHTEVNYLYERYCEDSLKVTVISVDASHYDLIKKAGLINFSEDKIAEIEQSAYDYLLGSAIPDNEETRLKFKKKFGVIEFFKEKSKQGLDIIFNHINEKYETR